MVPKISRSGELQKRNIIFGAIVYHGDGVTGDFRDAKLVPKGCDNFWGFQLRTIMLSWIYVTGYGVAKDKQNA